MAAFHSFRTTTLVYIAIHLLASFVQLTYAAPMLPIHFRPPSTVVPRSPGPRLPFHFRPPSVVPRSLQDANSVAPPHTLNITAPTTLSYPIHRLAKREKFTLQTLPNGELVAFSAATSQVIPQGPASDGAGKDFDAPAILWLGYCLVVGIPMAFGGLRLGRIATGAGVGGTAAMLAWASLINSVGPDSLADLVILLVVFGFFLAGFVGGLLRLGTYLGMVLIGITAGLSIGIRIILFKDGLLISSMASYAANWVVIGVIGAMGAVVVVKKNWQRWGVAGGCASIGTFLVFLGVDLAINRQSGYKPTISTQILLGASLGVTPLLAWAQHHFFRAHPFLPNSREPAYADPTMGRYTTEPESIYVDNSTADNLLAPPPPSQQRSHRAGTDSLGNMRSSVMGWLGIASGGAGRPAPGRPGAAVVYQGHAMRSVGQQGHGNVLGKIRPMRKNS